MPGKLFRSLAAFGSRVRAEWRLKVLLTVVLNLVFWIGYGFLSRHSFLPLQNIPLTWLDRAIPFQPRGWSWIYVSEFLLTATVPWLIVRREMLSRYARGVVVMSAICFLIFALYPVASPRPDTQFRDAMLGAILFLDGPFNAFPSLHAVFLVYTLGVAWILFRSQLHWFTMVLGLTWAAGVMYATMATRQHYALDLVAGGTIGWLACWLAWHPAFTASTRTRSSNAEESQVGSR